METYQEFSDRINSFEKKEITFGDSYFKGNPSIAQKVNAENLFQNFYGDTVVFELEDRMKDRLAEYVDLLYLAVPQCFCERLISDTFHVTLHDLGNARFLRDVAEELFENECRIVQKLDEVHRFQKAEIKMKSNPVFNMVNTSLVMGLYPADETAYYRLMELYDIFDHVKRLDYPFTPHITLAYYNVRGFDRQSAEILEDVVRRLNDREMEITLKVSNLYYQKFRSMNDYINIICLGK